MPMTSIKETFSEVIAELKDYIEAKKSLIELKATEKGAPIVAKSIYGSILVVLSLIVRLSRWWLRYLPYHSSL